MSARMLWPSIKQPKLMQILQTQGCRAGIDGNLFHDITSERDVPSDATSSRASNLPAPKLIYFSNLYDALKARMHSKHKFGHANPTTSYYSYYEG